MPSQSYYSALEGRYILHQTLGTGGFAKVKLATHVQTGEKVAIKIMNKKSLGEDLPRIKLEMEALKELNHQNICKLFQIIETDSRIYLIMEYCPGGELFDYIIERERLLEDEARIFFRQIVAAVAYMHHKGYSHRDLKPENLLLDAGNKLKLIDFGLCAKPKSLMKEQLKTCCGSPAYAAPELVSGDNYNGSKVDVWSMGVLLYALLCGFLPFDDENIPKLYRKIQAGKYSRPPWLSPESKSILAEMLEVDPDERISISELLYHPWVLQGTKGAVNWRSIYEGQEIDHECLAEMAVYHGRSLKYLESTLQKNKYDDLTASYSLLLSLKRQGKQVRLIHPSISVLQESKQLNRNLVREFNKNSSKIVLPSDESIANYDGLSLCSAMSELENIPITPTPSHKVLRQISKLSEVDKENFAMPQVPTPKRNKKTRSKTSQNSIAQLPLTASNSLEFEVSKTPVQSFRSSPLPSDKRAKSFESPLNDDESTKTPSRKNGWENLSAKKVFGSIEKGIDRMKNMLTPSKRFGLNTPRKIKEVLCNVSATNDKVSPDEVLASLQNALQLKGIFCKQKGYTLRGKVRDPHGAILLKFELEVCRLAKHQQAVGVRRKRLEGDTWHYKRVCEEVLKIAQLAKHY